VEFALVAPCFFLFIFALIELGRGSMVIHLLNNAARTGCRQSILKNQTTATVTSTVSTLLNSQGIRGSSTTMTVNGKSADVSTANSGDDISVTVTVAVANVTWIPGSEYLFGNMSGQFSLRKE